MLGVGLQQMDRETRARDQLGGARADAEWTTAKINLNKEVADASDPDDLTANQPAKYEAALSKAALHVPEDKRDLWLTHRRSELATANVGVQNRSFTLNRDRSLAEDQETLRILSEQAPNASPDDRRRIEDIASRIFQGWKDNGYVQRSEGSREPSHLGERVRGHQHPGADPTAAYRGAHAGADGRALEDRVRLLRLEGLVAGRCRRDRGRADP